MKIAALIAAAALPLMLPATASAATSNGTLSFASLRTCRGVAANIGCPGGPTIARSFDGAPGSRASATSLLAGAGTAQAGSFGAASVELGDLQLPVLHAISFAAGTNARVNGSAQGWQSFIYNGAAATPFGLSGTLTIDRSVASPADGTMPGGGIYVVFIGIWDAAAFPVDPADAFLGLPGAGMQCGTPGLLGFGVADGIGPGGAANITLSTAGCNGALLLSPGQEVIVHANMSLFTNRGGFIDASHTFVTALDPALGSAVIADLRANLTPGVPEPAAWALLITGFAAVGARLRRRRWGQRVTA